VQACVDECPGGRQGSLRRLLALGLHPKEWAAWTLNEHTHAASNGTTGMAHGWQRHLTCHNAMQQQSAQLRCRGETITALQQQRQPSRGMPTAPPWLPPK
jgi:hypothetical protein